MLEIKKKDATQRGAEVRHLFRPGRDVPAESFPVILLIEDGKLHITSWAVACQILYDHDRSLVEGWLPAIPTVDAFPDMPCVRRMATSGRLANLWKVWTQDATGLWLERDVS